MSSACGSANSSKLPIEVCNCCTVHVRELHEVFCSQHLLLEKATKRGLQFIHDTLDSKEFQVDQKQKQNPNIDETSMVSKHFSLLEAGCDVHSSNDVGLRRHSTVGDPDGRGTFDACYYLAPQWVSCTGEKPSHKPVRRDSKSVDCDCSNGAVN